MKRIANRGLALLMAVLMCMSFLTVAGVHNHAHAADVQYKYSGSYIYNWGKRGVPATELSPNAKAFYTGDYTYEKLSQLTGGTGVSDAPNSELYSALKTLMTSKHTHQTSYQETRDLYQYTDCENNGNPSTISSFYSGLAIGPAWDGGSTWNREHTWPNSKGLGGADENDIMMLRPTEKSENGSRSNKAYGESSGYYNPNSASNNTHDVRGDVARIFLYVYVRWGNVNGNGEYTTWGSTGVMESLDVLLKWMEEDPVDTWELGRNDSVQSITGTRNVFVDYPALANQLFSDPNGGNGSNSGNNPAPTYGVIDTPVAGTAYKFGMIQENKSATDVYYLKGGMAQTYYLDTTTDKDAALDVYLEETTGGYYLYTMLNGTKTYINMVVSGTHVNGAYETNASTVYTYDASSKTVIANVNGADYRFGTRNDKTYTTVGPVNVTYGNFYCKFYGVIGGTPGGDPGSNPGGGEGSDPNPSEPTTATITFDDKAKRTEQDSTHQVWVENGITVTNNKAASTSPVADYVNPARFYASSELIIEYPGMTKIEVTCNNSTYANDLKNSVTQNGDDNSTATVSGNVVTITLTVKADSCTITKLTKQVRVDSITVYAEGSNPGGGEGGEGGEGTEPESRTVRIYYPAGNSYVTSVASGTKLKAGNEREAAIWTMTAEGEYYSFSCNDKYLTSGPTGNKLSLSDTLTDCGKWELEETTGGYYIRNVGAAYNGNHNQYLEYYSGFTTYGFKANQYYVFQLKDAVTPDQCTHEWEAATCTEPKTCKICYTTEGEALGHDWAAATCTEPKTCKVCSTTSGSALGHNYEGGACTVCGAEDPNKGLTIVGITFDNTSKRTEISDTKQVWQENGITVTNNKAASTSNVANYSNPVRFYQGSELIIEYPGMVKIEVTCNSTSYATALKNSIPANSATVTVSGKVVTITLPAAADSFKVARLGAQVRVNSITVYAECQHEEWFEATCTSPKTCKNCGETEGVALGHDYLPLMTTKATCDKDGKKFYMCSNNCGEFVEIKVKATGHKMVDGICTACGLTEDVVVIDPVTICGGSEECPLHTFTDLSAGGWYHDGVHYCVSNGLFKGVSDDKFAPNETLTRAQIITILWRLAGSPVVNYAMDFEDVANDQWYTEAIRWAASQEMLDDIAGAEFGVNTVITREQFALVLYRFALCDGQYVTIDGDLDYFFDDAAEVSDYAVRALEWAFGEGLIQGVSDTELDPSGSVTRAQAATILYRYSENVVE